MVQNEKRSSCSYRMFNDAWLVRIWILSEVLSHFHFLFSFSGYFVSFGLLFICLFFICFSSAFSGSFWILLYLKCFSFICPSRFAVCRYVLLLLISFVSPSFFFFVIVSVIYFLQILYVTRLIYETFLFTFFFLWYHLIV